MIPAKTILHVDDDTDDRFVVKLALNNIDPSIKVQEAENGLVAIEHLKKASVTGELPALIILDFNMPIMNGMETYKEIRKYPEFSSIPVVLLTTSTNNREEAYWQTENVATFTKPATYRELTTSIKQIMSFSHPLSATN